MVADSEKIYRVAPFQGSGSEICPGSAEEKFEYLNPEAGFPRGNVRETGNVFSKGQCPGEQTHVDAAGIRCEVKDYENYQKRYP